MISLHEAVTFIQGEKAPVVRRQGGSLGTNLVGLTAQSTGTVVEHLEPCF